MKLRILLDIGHGYKGDTKPAGKRSKPIRIEDPGVVVGSRREIDVATIYTLGDGGTWRGLLGELEDRGYPVHRITPGPYADRQAEAAELAAAHPGDRCVYLQSHVNAGGGRYALVEHDRASEWGQAAAELLAEALGELSEVSIGKVASIGPGERGWICIDGIRPLPTTFALLLEPGFLDTPAHDPLWGFEGLRHVARQVAIGLDRYARTL